MRVDDDVSQAPGLSIGELAGRTGVAVATLRAWELRHRFPEPHHTTGGHRRYAEDDVAAVIDVRRRQASGMRLAAAIDEVTGEVVSAPGAGSLFAQMRTGHPHLAPRRLSKRTLLAMSWAIEDEFAARGDRPHLFGAFQHARHFARSSERWGELARVARSTYVMADFTDSGHRGSTDRVVEVDLPVDAPMRREWAVVCHSAHVPAALTAWEVPGQRGTADRDRIFEAVWTVDPVVVHDAARLCAQVCADSGAPGAADLVATLAGPPPTTRTDVNVAVALLDRMVVYVDRDHR